MLATQTMAIKPMKVRRLQGNGELRPGVYAKDVILHIIKELGVNGGLGYAYEYAGDVFDRFTMEERMTVCNMSIEGGARCGYVNPDETTFEYLQGRPYAPKGADWDAAVERWRSYASDPGCHYDDVVIIDGGDIEQAVARRMIPGPAIAVSATVPTVQYSAEAERENAALALVHMMLQPRAPIERTPFDVPFLGSCTNGRFYDFIEAAKYLEGK